MSKIDKFLAKPVEVEIAGDKYMIEPFTVSDFSMMNRMASKDPDVAAKALIEAVTKIMKQIDSEATEEQIGKIKVDVMNEILEVVTKINNLEIDDAKAKLITDIKNKQNA